MPASPEDLAAYAELRRAGFSPKSTVGAANLKSRLMAEAKHLNTKERKQFVATEGKIPLDPTSSDGPLGIQVQIVDRGDYGDEIAVFTWTTGDWRMSGEVAAVGHRLLVRRLTIEPSPTVEDRDGSQQPRRTPPAGGISGQLLRKIRFDDLLNEVRTTLTRAGRRYGSWARRLTEVGIDPSATVDSAKLAQAAAMRIVDKTSTHRGRKALPDELLRDISLVYLDVCESVVPPGGIWRAISVRLAEKAGVDPGEPGRETYPIPKIRYWISQARHRKFLTSAVAGKAGASRGPRLQEAPHDS